MITSTRRNPRAIDVPTGAVLGLCAVMALHACARKTPPAPAPSPAPLDQAAAEAERYIARSKTSEAVEGLSRLYRGMVMYVTADRMARGATGTLTARMFPVSAPRTPAKVPAGVTVTDPPGTWSNDTWQALEFSLADPHRYSYEVVTSGSGPTAAFTVRALGDLDGDGVFSTFERSGQLNAELEVEGSKGIWMKDELE